MAPPCNAALPRLLGGGLLALAIAQGACTLERGGLGDASSSSGGGGATGGGGLGGLGGAGGAGGAATTGAGGSGGAFCGDGAMQPPEQCDDANAVSGDGCTPECLVEDPANACPGEPVVLTLGGATVSGDTTKKTLKGASSCGGLSSPDLVYEVAPAVSGTMTVTIAAGFGSPVLYLLGGCPDGPELACATQVSSPQLRKVVLGGQKYSLFVDGSAGTAGPFTLQLFLSTCGDGVIEAGEECDDQNDASLDGCTECVVDCGCTTNCDGVTEWRDQVSHHCYRLETSSKQSWNNARALCDAWGGELAAPSTPEELVLVAPFIAMSGGDVWLGGNDQAVEGAFAWSNGEPFVFAGKASPWASNEPNDFFMGEDCVEALSSSLLNDDACSRTNHFMCERSPAGL